MRAHCHQHVGKALNQHAEISLRSIFPDIFQSHAVGAAYVNAIEGAGDRIKPGCIDDDVEFIRAVACLDTGRCDAFDWCRCSI
jgi:hypothetical protein